MWRSLVVRIAWGNSETDFPMQAVLAIAKSGWSEKRDRAAGVASIAALFRLLAKLRTSLHLASFTSTKSCHPDQYKILLARGVFYMRLAKNTEISIKVLTFLTISDIYLLDFCVITP